MAKRSAAMSSILAITLLILPTTNANLPAVGTRQFEIWYQINEDASLLHSVLIWYTNDMGKSWHLAGRDHDREPPMAFRADADGRYGFYVVATNAYGASANPPSPGTIPQFETLIDSTPPLVQVHDTRLTRTAKDIRMLEINWSAVDDHLTDRPIEIAYRILPTNAWTQIEKQLTNTGKYHWNLPDELVGRISIRITARDRGGHKVSAESQIVDIPFESKENKSPDELQAAQSAWLRDLPNPTTPDWQPVATTEESALAKRMFEQAEHHRRRGENELAIVRYRDALKLDPTIVPALTGLGSVLHDRDPEAAIHAYELALRQKPLDRDALRGHARALVKKHEYSAAERSLSQLIKQYPDDVEAWLHLGDIAVYRGDPVSAAQHYRTSMTRRPSAQDVIKRAKSRLQNLDQLMNLYASE
jgi:tetratricopeptide (TPR) repeat protein